MLRTVVELFTISFVLFVTDYSDALHYQRGGTIKKPAFSSRLAQELAKSSASSHRIHIWVMVPFDDYYAFSKNHVAPAVYQALQDVNATLCDELPRVDQSSNQNGTCYKVIFNDTRCDVDYAMARAVDIQGSTISAKQCIDSELQNDLDVIVGMSCDGCAGRVSMLATCWKWPVIFVGTRTTLLDNKSQSCCQTLTRTGHTASDLGNFVYALYNEYVVWSQSYFVFSRRTDHGAPVLDQDLSDCATLISGIATVFDSKHFTDYVLYPVNSDEELLDSAEQILQKIKISTRASIWCVGRKAMRNVMNTASLMGMIGDAADEQFAFFYIDLYNANTSFRWSDVDDQPCSQKDYCTKNVGNSSDGMRALQVITLHQPETTKYREFSDTMMAKMDQIVPGLGGRDQFVNPYVPEYYNAIRLLVNGVQKGIEENRTNWSDGAEFARRLWNSSFQSVDGDVFIAKSGDQAMNYALMDMDETTELFEVAAVYYGFNTSFINVRQIDWPGPNPAPNEPIRGSDGTTNETDTTLPRSTKEMIAFVTILAILLITTIFVLRRKFRRENKVSKMTWKVSPDEVNYGTRERTTSMNSSGSNVSDPHFSASVVRRQLFTTTAQWKNHLVAVKHVKYVKKVDVDRELQLEMEMLVSIDHEHLCKIYGASVEAPILVLTEYCPRGSLQDFVEGDMFKKLDDVFTNSLILDIAHGMQFLHKTAVHSHGKLKSSNCLLTSRLVVKITDFGMTSLRPRMQRDSIIGYNHHKDLLWTAPELLRATRPSAKGTQKGDVYSFAIVVQEILYAMGAFYLGEEKMSSDEICRRVEENATDVPFRPTLENNDEVVLEDRMRSLVQECWAEDPGSRPTFHQITGVMTKYVKKHNLFDQMLKRLEQYSITLEDKVEERTMQYKAEKERADNLLYQMLPKGVTDKLKRGQNIEPAKFDSATIYFSDIVGFTAISHRSTPLEVVDMLDNLYTVFDEVVDLFDVYKVETIGDAYMVVSGLPETNGKQHVIEISRLALSLMEKVKVFKIPHMPEKQMELRIGIHSGPVVAGVVGKKMPRYCLFGDTVNTAARMEQNGQSMRIHISPATKFMLDEFESFHIKKREEKVIFKGLGNWQTWWLEGELPENDSSVKANRSHELTDEIYPYGEKKESSTSDYGSIHSGPQESLYRKRLSVTGVDPEEYEVNSVPNLVTYETECNRRTSRLYSLQEGAEVVPKRRRTGVNEIPEELLREREHLKQRQKERSSSGLQKLAPAESLKLKAGWKGKLDKTYGDGEYPASSSRKHGRKKSGLVFHNGAYKSEDSVDEASVRAASLNAFRR